MFKKFLSYQIFLVVFLLIIFAICFGALIRNHFLGVPKFKSLQKTSLLIASIPSNIAFMYENKTFNLNKPKNLKKHLDKLKFKKFTNTQRSGLLILSRHDRDNRDSIVEIIDLENFEVIHTYNHDVEKMIKMVKNKSLLPNILIDNKPTRFRYVNPLILKDGSLISHLPLFKLDFCSNLLWINDDLYFHHSIMKDNENFIWTGGELKPYSKFVKKYQIHGFKDDAIVKVDTNGKLVYKKSVLEILIENNILPDNYALTSVLFNVTDPIHLNDIEPALFDSDFWLKGDLFLSLRHQSAIVHYRPSTNKIINYITGPFSQQHDVDILSHNEISIFNNNNFGLNNEYSEVLVYNFENRKFKKIFNDQLISDNFKTETEGLSQILKDGAMMIEETNHGRIILYDSNKQKEWEFVNKNNNGEIGLVTWSRIIEDKNHIDIIKKLVDEKLCKD